MLDDKSFLDTSVVRGLLCGGSKYKRYLDSQLDSRRLYISAYVKMEIRRSFVRNIIDFYFLLDNPSIKTFDDALEVWSNKFKSSQLKAVIQLVSQLFRYRKIDSENPRDKVTAICHLEQYLFTLCSKIEYLFKDVGRNQTKCGRAARNLKFGKNDLPRDAIERFARSFDDVSTCRSECKVDRFFLQRYTNEREMLQAKAQQVERGKMTASKAFRDVISNLEDISSKGASGFTCKACEKIGDAVIALEAPRDMQLEYGYRAHLPVNGR